MEQLEADPVERLALARKYMPLPAAFREAAEALRVLILKQAKEETDGIDLLSELYLTAARENFLLGTPSIVGVGSAYSVATAIPRNVWMRLRMPYAEIGYRHLPLLTPTDCDWFVGAWGEPDTHVSAQAYHQSVWDEHARTAGRERWIGSGHGQAGCR